MKTMFFKNILTKQDHQLIRSAYLKYMIVQNLSCHVRQPVSLILEMLHYMLSQVFVTREMFILQRSKGFVHMMFRLPNHPSTDIFKQFRVAPARKSI